MPQGNQNNYATPQSDPTPPGSYPAAATSTTVTAAAAAAAAPRTERLSSTSSKSEESEWTFENISDFISIPRDEKKLDVTLKDANIAELRLGHIIYIQEEDSRLQNRVMLVIRQKGAKAYVTCLALCRHWRAFEELDDHWRVESLSRAAAPRTDAADIRERRTIQVHLRPECPNVQDREFALYPGTTVDIWSWWHVAHNVKVMVLGSVTEASLKALGRKLAEVSLASFPGCGDFELVNRRLVPGRPGR